MGAWIKTGVTILSNVEESHIYAIRYLDAVEQWLAMRYRYLAKTTKLESQFPTIDDQTNLTEIVNQYYTLGRLLQDRCAGREGEGFENEYRNTLTEAISIYSKVTVKLDHIAEQIAI